jgi:hypothetical protein
MMVLVQNGTELMATQVRQEQPSANAQLGLSCGQKALSDCTKLQPTRPRLVSLKQQVLSNCAEQNDGLAAKNGLPSVIGI